jgi:hypothetical protein
MPVTVQALRMQDQHQKKIQNAHARIRIVLGTATAERAWISTGTKKEIFPSA